MRKSLIASVAAAVGLVALAPVTAAADDDSSSEAPSMRPTLAQILTSDRNDFDRNPYDFDIVTQAVLLFPDLVEAASNPDAELTVFIPTDQAFRLLVKDITGQWIRNEADLFDAVASLGVDTVETVLLYHIVPAKISYRDALGADGAVLGTLLDGATVEVDVKRFWRWQYIRIIDADSDDVNPRVVRPNVGGEAANGYAHGIDRVLRPINLP